MSFEKKLQSLRKKAGLSQEELANQLGVSRQAVSKWESGISYPEMDKLILMTRLFKCSLDDLVNDEIKEPIIEDNIKKKQKSVDSLLEFITKSISMFNSMKLSSVLKCFAEIIVLICVLALVSACIFSIIEAFLASLFSITFYPIYAFLTSLVFFVVIILDAIIVFQFYKIRYLDYYDKLVYQYEVKSFNCKDIQSKDEEDVMKKENIEIVSKEKKEMKARERIIIRDPNHKPLEFLSFFSKLLILTYRAIMRIITIPFIFLLVFLVIATVLVIYLISYNGLFIGVSIAAFASILLTVLVIRTLSDDLFKGTYPIKIMAILFLVSLVVGGIGVGISIISFKNINFEYVETIETVEKEYPYNDKLYLNFLESRGHHIIFKVNESLDNILISYNYDKTYENVELVNPAEDENYLLLETKYINNNPKEEIDKFLANLKKNLIVLENYHDYEDIIGPATVTAREKYIKQLINNIGNRDDISVDIRKQKGTNYYHVYSFNQGGMSDAVCDSSDGYRKCFRIIDDTRDQDFEYKFKDGKIIYDEERFVCEPEYINYHCREI